MSIDKSTIISWIQQSIGTDNFTIDIEGTTEKGEGYMAEFLLVKVNLSDDNTNKKELHLAVKMGKVLPGLQKKCPMMEEMYKREVVFYDQVIPAFQKFQTEKNIQEPFNAVPKCYKTFLDENMVVIVMENLKKKNYELHPKELPMNMRHARMSLRNYAKFHALSFAMQDQKKDVFDRLTTNYYLYLKTAHGPCKPYYESVGFKVVNNLKEIGREDLSLKYKKFMENNIYNRLMDIFDDTPNERTIVHADCHSSNFLFKYKDIGKHTPSNMVFLDFQTSSFHSPMLDVSDFVYRCLSEEGFSQFNELMEFYYNEFSSFLTQLGSDPNKLFPESAMWDHWRRYSGYGFIIAATYMEIFFVEKEEAPSMNGDDNTEILDGFTNIKLSDSRRKMYLDRLVSILEHYFNFQNVE